MKSNSSITADEKNLLEYLYGKACDIVDYCHRNNMILPVIISVRPDYKSSDGKIVFDCRDVMISEDYESGNTKRIVSLGYNPYNGKAEYDESLYEDETE